jgi:hypothetical protein
MSRRRVLTTAALALVPATACLLWGAADLIVPPLIRRLDAAWESRAAHL